MGGGLGAWAVGRANVTEGEAEHEYTLTGMAGGLGSAFSAPLFGAILVSELSPTEKRRYVTAFIPQLIAATLGFVVFFGVTGSAILDAYEVPSYQFENLDLLIAVFLGILGALVLLVFIVVDKIVAAAAALIPNRFARASIGGAMIGLIAVALPLTLTSGSSQLKTVIDSPVALGAGFIAIVLIAKMVAVSLSLASGFLGGNVFPMIFIGGASGVLVHLLFPDIPLSLSVAAMMAAVPGAFLEAPVSLTLIAAATIGLEPTAIVPVTIAVVVAFLSFSVIRRLLARRSASAS